MEALPQTNHIKSIVTLEDKIDIERKGYDEKCINNHRGFHHICREEWKTFTGPTPFD